MGILGPYKGFQGSVEYDAGIFLIRLLHIDDAISTTCKNAPEVESAFEELVDDYLDTCEQIGKEPKEPTNPQASQEAK